MSRRVRRFGLLVVVLACVPVLPPATAAEPAAITQTGWWSQRPGAAEVPDGGFELAFSLNGPVSQAAIRVDVDAVQLTFALLELKPTGEVAPDVASVRACPTAGAWAPANPGAWNDRPPPNCDGPNLTLARRQTGEWGIDLAPLLHVGTNSIVLVPESHPDTQGFPAPYQLEFARPTLFASAPSLEPPPSGGGGGGTAPPAPAPGRRSVVAAPRNPPSAPGPAAPPIVLEPSASDPSASDLPRAAPVAVTGNEVSRPWWRLLLLIPLSAAAGAGAVLARRFAAARGVAGA